MSIMLPKREYVVKALNQMDQSEALLLRMRWGLKTENRCPLLTGQVFQSDPGQNNGRIKKSRISGTYASSQTRRQSKSIILVSPLFFKYLTFTNNCLDSLYNQFHQFFFLAPANITA